MSIWIIIGTLGAIMFVAGWMRSSAPLWLAGSLVLGAAGFMHSRWGAPDAGGATAQDKPQTTLLDWETKRFADIEQKTKALAVLRARLADATKTATATYNVLQKERAALEPGDQAALEDYNRRASAYSEQRATASSGIEQIKALEAEIIALKNAQPPVLIAKPAAAGKPAGAKAGGHQVVIFTTSWCGACKMAKSYLASKGISYREEDVEKSPAALLTFRKYGGNGVPLILIDGRPIRGFNQAAIEDALAF